MQIDVLPDADAAARAAGAAIAEAARQAVAARGRFTLALSGGAAAPALFRSLAGEDLPWADVHLFQVDERVASEGHGDRNLELLREHLFGRVSSLRDEQLHAIPVENEDLTAAAAAYETVLRRWAGDPPVLDLVHLGLGGDGHTASLVPGDRALEANDREVVVSGIYGGRRRLSLSFPAIDRARQRLWLVTGAPKSEVLTSLLHADTQIPAGRVEQRGARVFADRAAVS